MCFEHPNAVKDAIDVGSVHAAESFFRVSTCVICTDLKFAFVARICGSCLQLSFAARVLRSGK